MSVALAKSFSIRSWLLFQMSMEAMDLIFVLFILFTASSMSRMRFGIRLDSSRTFGSSESNEIEIMSFPASSRRSSLASVMSEGAASRTALWMLREVHLFTKATILGCMSGSPPVRVI